MTRLWPLALGGVVAAPLVTWLPMLAHRVPALGLPPYQPAAGIDAWQMQIFLFLACATAAALVAPSDRWLALAVVLAGLTLCYRGARLDPTHTVVFAFGALILTGLRSIPEVWRPKIRRWLLILGGLQAVYVTHQYLGYDLLWGPALGGTLKDTVQPLGLLGSVNATAGYLAILAPLAPWYLAILFAGLVLSSKSLGAVLALLCGLIWKLWLTETDIIGTVARTARRDRIMVAGFLAIATTAIAVPLSLWLQKSTQAARIVMWNFGLADWWKTDPVIGYGLGGWMGRIPALQAQTGFSPTGELWAEAHNEPIQWLCEMGLVGAVLLVAWCWSQRRMFVDRAWGGPLMALAVTTLTWHTFHIVSTALVGLVLIGLATPHKEAEACAV